MMIENRYIVFILVFFLGLSACEKDSNVAVPITSPKLVTACFLSPTADGTELRLTWSAPIFHTTNHDMPFEKNADVYISDGSNEYKAQYEVSNDRYFISKNDLQIDEGKKYSLKIQSSKSKDLSAETIIPLQPIFSITFQSVDSVKNDKYSPNSYSYRYFIKLNITNGDSKAYYRISVKGLAKNNGNSQIESLFVSGGENRIIHGDYSGTLVTKRTYSYGGQIKRIYVNVHRVDETYYLYHHALENYSGADIFSEPTLVYSNMENGFGVFCSYNNVTDSVEVKK